MLNSDKVKKKLKKYCTMSPIMAIPETTLGNRFSGGKWGSSKPVTGFRSTAGANAAKVGRGLSWKENRKSRMLYTLISCALISARALLSLSAVGGVTQVTKVLARVVQTLDSAIHRINHYPVDSVIDFPNTYPLDSDLSAG